MRNLKPAYDLIKEFEGCRLNAYLDPAGIPTIGWGSIRNPDGSPIKMGQKITQSQADEWLEFEVEKFAKSVEKLIQSNTTNNEFCALVSFAYNVGADIDADTKAEGLGDSTLLQKHNDGDKYGAAQEFQKWNKAGGKVLKGLTRRRAAERELYQKEQSMFQSHEAEDIVENLKEPWYKEMFRKMLALVFDEKAKDSAVIPDNPTTGAPAKREMVLSEGSGPRISLERVKEILESMGVDTTKFVMLGIRGYYLDTYGAKGENDRGVYDDAIIQFWGEGFYTFRANNDASKYRKGHGFGSEKGMAMLKKGVWPGYYPGMHNGSVPHLAFRQGKPVTVVRDGTKGNYEETGLFGINIHRGGSKGTSSLGCQTIMPQDWDFFKKLGDKHLARLNQKSFSYCLVDEKDLRNEKKLT